jgi:hypothetical protein
MKTTRSLWDTEIVFIFVYFDVPPFFLLFNSVLRKSQR